MNKKYTAHVICEGNTKMLYMKDSRAIYSCLESIILWYNLYVTTLKGIGFELNSYNICVANKIINGKQYIILWYVDDNKISQVDLTIVDSIIKIITKSLENYQSLEANNIPF